MNIWTEKKMVLRGYANSHGVHTIYRWNVKKIKNYKSWI